MLLMQYYSKFNYWIASALLYVFGSRLYIFWIDWRGETSKKARKMKKPKKGIYFFGAAVQLMQLYIELNIFFFYKILWKDYNEKPVQKKKFFRFFFYKLYTPKTHKRYKIMIIMTAQLCIKTTKVGKKI